MYALGARQYAESWERCVNPDLSWFSSWVLSVLTALAGGMVLVGGISPSSLVVELAR